MSRYYSQIKGLPVGFLAVERSTPAARLIPILKNANATFPVGCTILKKPTFAKKFASKGYECFHTFVIVPDGTVAWVGTHFGEYNDGRKRITLEQHVAALNSILEKYHVQAPRAAD